MAEWLTELAADEANLDVRVRVDGALTADHAPPNVLPHVLAALLRELPHWERGDDWNSQVRIARVRRDRRSVWVFGVTERLRFHETQEGLVVLLDATADSEVLAAAVR